MSRLCEIGQLKWKLSEVIINNSAAPSGDGFHDTPIGLSYFVLNCVSRIVKQFHHHDKLNSELLLVSMKKNTDRHRRKDGMNRIEILGNLQRNGFRNNLIDPRKYFSKIGLYKFIASPEGNGIDCHRHYEAWLSGGIPIIERNKLIEEKYKGLPILWTSDYSEITADYLKSKRSDFIGHKFDYSRLFMDYYSTDKQREIKERCNYWIKKYTWKSNYYSL